MKAPNGFKKGVSQWTQSATNNKVAPKKKGRRLYAFNKLRGFHNPRNSRPSRCVSVLAV